MSFVNFKNISSYKQIYKTIISIIFLSVIITLLIISLILSYEMIYLGKDINDISNIKLFTIVGESMNPKFNAGDLIIVKKAPLDKIKIGDIISFKEGSLIITHRINDIVDNKYITLGDNNILQDKYPIDSEKILGKYVFSIPKGDYILSLTKTPIFTVLIFLLFLTNIALLFRSLFG